ncbi:MAG: O-antigen ligase family protein [Candidatus Acidiferrales bacterium]
MKVIRVGICALVAFAVLAQGATEAWSQAVVEIGAGLLLVWWCFAVLREELVEVHGNVLLWPLAGLWIVAMVQSIPGLSAYEFATRIEWLKGSALIVLVFLAVQSFRTTKDWREFVWFLLVLGFLASLLGIVQQFTFNGKMYWFREMKYGGVPFGPYVNRNHFAGFVELVVPPGLAVLVLRGERRDLLPLLAILTLLPIGALFLAASRGGIIAFLCEIVVLVLLVAMREKEWRTLAAGFLILFLASAMVAWIGVGPSLERFAEYRSLEVTEARRVEMTRDSLKIFRDHPVLGTGFGTLQQVFPRYETLYDGLVVDHAHDDYVELLSDAGAVGALLGAWFLVLLFWQGAKSLRSSRGTPDLAVHIGALTACVGLLIHSLSDFNLHIPANALIFLLLAALATSSTAPPGPLPVPSSAAKTHARGELRTSSERR